MVPQMRAKPRKKRCSWVKPSTFCGSGLGGQFVLEGHVRDGQPAEVGDAFAEHQLAVFVQIVRDDVAVELLFDAGGARLEILEVLGRPPVAQVALGVVLGGPGRRSRGSSRGR